MSKLRVPVWVAGAVLFVALGVAVGWADATKPEWAMNATAIEACSCPMFCQCYFNTKPAGHGDHAGHGGEAKHFCRANNAYKVNKGYVGTTNLDGGKTGEVKLKAFPGMGGQPVVMKNLPYWGAPRNDGFVMMPNEVEAYRVGPNAFEFKGTNGFMLTLDITSKDVKAAAAN